MTLRIYTGEVTQDLYALRVDDTRTKFFESLWYIPEGITYNSYLLMSGGKAVLFDGWKGTYTEEFLDNIKKIVDPRDTRG